MQFQTVSHWDLGLLLRLGQPASVAPESLLETILVSGWGELYRAEMKQPDRWICLEIMLHCVVWDSWKLVT